MKSHYTNLTDGRLALAVLRREGGVIGSVHTLGALHAAHGVLIKQSALENDFTVVTIYPNKIQLFPGSKYIYDLQRDVQSAFEFGANIVISSDDEEMFYPEYRTFITQGESHTRLNSSVFDFASRGQVTGTLRWLIYTQPTRSYFGLKDLEQAILVKQAARDLLLDCEIKFVPCIRSSAGVPISSRLRGLEPRYMAELASVYESLHLARRKLSEGSLNAAEICDAAKEFLSTRLKEFSLRYFTIVGCVDFESKTEATLPLIIHCCVQGRGISHFDGFWLQNAAQLNHGPEFIVMH